MRLPLIALFALGACTSQPPAANVTQSEETNITDDASPAPLDKRPIKADATPAATPAPAPAKTPDVVSEAPFSEDSAQGAANVVQTYYALIEAGKYGQAYALWSPGAAGMPREAFAASFAKYRDYHAEIGAPSAIEGAAGSRYVTVPVRAYGNLKAGGPFNLRGSVTLRRAAVDGATPEQRRWHISGSDLKPRPGEVPPATVDNRSQARFRCIDGVRIVARFDPDKGQVMLVRAGRTMVLQQQRMASGIRYSNGRVTFQGKGDNMTFEALGQPPVVCAVIR
ncbi:MliC family protein [Sphingomonas sp. HITSZ_GF]|uniref:MliC family protein n=1 Tax=Sphingomonas sp. HITSZ_GF TaxID=3037247 RepID=UPI00240D131E|nr:MliC family protein [Sphingomonas sp. HITSZ_GF]MDG2533276.1 MliC family protein [Sphingomonas sp. HITSZ_GF]